MSVWLEAQIGACTDHSTLCVRQHKIVENDTVTAVTNIDKLWKLRETSHQGMRLFGLMLEEPTFPQIDQDGAALRLPLLLPTRRAIGGRESLHLITLGASNRPLYRTWHWGWPQSHDRSGLRLRELHLHRRTGVGEPTGGQVQPAVFLVHGSGCYLLSAIVGNH